MENQAVRVELKNMVIGIWRILIYSAFLPSSFQSALQSHAHSHTLSHTAGGSAAKHWRQPPTPYIETTPHHGTVVTQWIFTIILKESHFIRFMLFVFFPVDLKRNKVFLCGSDEDQTSQ